MMSLLTLHLQRMQCTSGYLFVPMKLKPDSRRVNYRHQLFRFCHHQLHLLFYGYRDPPHLLHHVQLVHLIHHLPLLGRDRWDGFPSKPLHLSFHRFNQHLLYGLPRTDVDPQPPYGLRHPSNYRLSLDFLDPQVCLYKHLPKHLYIFLPFQWPRFFSQLSKSVHIRKRRPSVLYMLKQLLLGVTYRCGHLIWLLRSQQSVDLLKQRQLLRHLHLDTPVHSSLSRPDSVQSPRPPVDLKHDPRMDSFPPFSKQTDRSCMCLFRPLHVSSQDGLKLRPSRQCRRSGLWVTQHCLVPFKLHFPFSWTLSRLPQYLDRRGLKSLLDYFLRLFYLYTSSRLSIFIHSVFAVKKFTYLIFS